MRRHADDDQRKIWGTPPRSCTDLQTPAEAAIRAAIAEVERHPGAHPMLTEAVIKLGEALDVLGKYIDEVEP